MSRSTNGNLLIGRARLLTSVVPADPAGKAAVACQLYVLLSVLFFSHLAFEEPWVLSGLAWEDGWVENLTAVYWLLGSLSLFAAVLARRDSFHRRLYVIGGAAMVFLCGEEISWGQRILGFATPDYLLDLNYEFNLHNTRGLYWLFITVRDLGTLLLVVTTMAAFLRRRDKLFGISLPSIPLTFCFLWTLLYRRVTPREFPELQPLQGFVFAGQGEFWFLAVVCALVVIAFFYRRQELLVAAVANAVFVSVAAHVSVRLRFYFPRPTIVELTEYLFSLSCLFYALELWRGSREGRRPHHGERVPFRPAFLSPAAVRAWVIAGGIVLLPFGYHSARAVLAAAGSSPPAARAVFDVRIVGNRIVYVREPCVRDDTLPRFFLHLYPVDADELPARRREHGFDNRDFEFGMRYSRLSGGQCLATRPLPGYDLARIHTGQHMGEDRIWMASIDLIRPNTVSARMDSMTVGEYLADRVGDREPEIRSDFDVHLVENALIYVKDPCGPDDLDATFFLHVDAVVQEDLPDDRRRHGFDNLDFTFDALGVRVGATCAAEVPLPEYDVAAIRTGQYVVVEDGFRHPWGGEIRLEGR